MPPPLASPFVIDCPLQLAIGEHPQVAIVEPERVVVVELPSGALVAELGLQVEAEGVDVGWLGPTPRLLVVSRLPDHTQLHLLDITEKSGIRVCAEKRVEVAMRLLAVSGNYGLLCGAVSSAVLTRADDNVTMHPVAARGVPSAAGPLGNQLVVALPGVIELWDPVARVAKRRLKLPRPAQLRAVGGSERQIWLTTLAEPHRLEVLPLINRGQPKAHELDEPIAAVAGHPRLDVVVCTGADSGQVYVIDLDGRTPIRALGTDAFGGPPMALALLGGRTPAIVAVAAGQPPTLLALDGLPLTEWPGAPRAEGASSSVVAVPAASPAGAAPGAAAEPRRAEAREVFDSKLGHNVADPHPASAQQQPDNPRSIAGAATVLRAARADTRDGATDEEDPHRPKATPNEPATTGATGALLDRLASWRARTADEQLVDQQLEPGSVTTAAPAPVAVSQGASPRQLAPEATPGTTTATTTAAPPATTSATTSATTPGTTTAAPPPLAPARPAALGQLADWRTSLLEWASAGAARRGPPPPAAAMVQVLERLELPPETAAVLQLLYAAHLQGRSRVPPSEIAAMMSAEDRWREALGAGALAQCGAARLRGSRLALASEVRRFLDGRDAKHGELVDGAGAPPRRDAAAIVWTPTREPTPRSLGEALVRRLGSAVLVVTSPPLDGGELARVCLEARVRGAVAALPYPWAMPLAPGPLVYVAPSRHEAEATGLELL